MIHASGLPRCGSFALERGELVVLAGPNGSGKSTILRTLIGLEPPRSGRVEREAGLRCGYVPQLDPGDSGLRFPALTVVEQGLPGLFPGRRARHAAREALARAGFRAPHSRLYTRLSGGERRRVLLARALVGTPDILALDEATAGMDAEGEEATLRLVLEEVRGRGASAIWICHGATRVEAAADRVMRLA